MFNVPLSSRGLRGFYVAIGIANTVLLGAFALIQAERLRPGLVPVRELDPAYQLSLQKEDGVVAVWYSSMLLLLIAIVAVVNYWSDRASRADGRERWPAFRYGWLFLAAIGLFISADESSQFHEGIGALAGTQGGLHIEGLTEGIPHFAWVIVFAPVLVVSVLILVAFFGYWLAAVPRARFLAFIGIGCWAMVPVLEVVESRLSHTFGPPGARTSQFFEESFEVLGATFLLIAALEYLVARGVPVQATKVVPARSGRLAVAWGVAAPLLLIPLAGLGVTVDTELRERVVHAGYRYGAARMALVIDNLDPYGNYVVLSGGCSIDALRSFFPYEVRPMGSLVNYPPAAKRATSPDLVLTALDLNSGESPDRIADSLARVAMMSTHLWYLQCGAASETDGIVHDWLSQQSAQVERFRLPGVPPLVLMRIAPTIPLPHLTAGRELDNPIAFGDGEVELVGYDWLVDQRGEESVLRLVLFWQAPDGVETDYHIFVHLVDRQGELVAQSDGSPVYDRYPFSRWVPGEIVADSYDVLLPADVPIGEAEVRLGLYEFETGERLPVDGSDHITLSGSGDLLVP